jgi:hypothetical protein
MSENHQEKKNLKAKLDLHLLLGHRIESMVIVLKNLEITCCEDENMRNCQSCKER